jgi:hypothetical protein
MMTNVTGISDEALGVLKEEAQKGGPFANIYNNILVGLNQKGFFSVTELQSIQNHAEARELPNLRNVYIEKIEAIKKGQLFRQFLCENIALFCIAMVNVIAFMFCTGLIVIFLPFLSLVAWVLYSRVKKPLVLSCVMYVISLIFYKAFGWEAFYTSVLYPLVMGMYEFVVNFGMAPFTDLFEYVRQSIASACSTVAEYIAKLNKTKQPQQKGDRAANASNATAPRECPPSAGLACDFSDFLGSVGGFRGLAMMFGLVTKVMLAVNGTFVFVNGSDNASATILSSHAPIPSVVDQQRFHHNLFLKERNQVLSPADLYSKFEVQAKAMVEKAIEEERKKIATMIAAAIEEDRKMKLAEEEQLRAKKGNDWFFPALTSVGMAVGYGVVWEISKQACLKAVRLIGGNPRFQPLVRAAHLVMSVAPLVYTQDAEAVAGGGGMLAVGTQVFSGVGVSTLAFQVLGYVGKMIYEYALTPVEARIITAEDLARNAPPEAGNPMTPPGAAALSRAANGGGSNVHTITTTK